MPFSVCTMFCERWFSFRFFYISFAGCRSLPIQVHKLCFVCAFGCCFFPYSFLNVALFPSFRLFPCHCTRDPIMACRLQKKTPKPVNITANKWQKHYQVLFLLSIRSNRDSFDVCKGERKKVSVFRCEKIGTPRVKNQPANQVDFRKK